MKLQQVVWRVPPTVDTTLYYRRKNVEGELITTPVEDCLLLKTGDCVSFDTFFHSFSIKKWKQYTNITHYSVAISGSGKLQCRLYGVWRTAMGTEKKLLTEQQIFLQTAEVYNLAIPETDCDVCYLEFESMESESALQTIVYNGESEIGQREISLAIDICTYKREPYVKRNLQMLQDTILDNTDSPLYNKVEVFISDNADTLGNMFENYKHVHVNPNENVGGVGGFTRGMIEAMEYPAECPFTHVLIMDDDAVIEPMSIERTYVLLANLKPEYQNATVGGALLRENTPYVQFESGAAWNRGNIKANHHHYDLRDFDMVVANEQEEKTEYTGWWYTAIPVQQIQKVGLPLPLFIHRDDIEYGIRAGKENFILLNGIAVWHEAFENKMPGATEYYDLRNMAIINCIHYADYSRKELQYFLKKWVISNIVRYRYDYVDMNIKGIQDFCKGIDWLKAQDGQELHQSIMKMNYKAKPATEYIGYRDIRGEDIQWDNLEQVEDRRVGTLERLCKMATFNGAIFPGKGIKVVRPHNNLYDIFRTEEVLYVDSAGNGLLLKRDNRKAKECFRKLRIALRNLDERFDEVKREYAERYPELTSTEFWKRYLKMQQ